MEFSFDRSNETHLRNTTQSRPQSAKPEERPQPQTAPHDDGIDTSTIANERLRKAIERNRARQAERNRQAGQSASAQNFSQPQAQPAAAASQEQASLFDKPQEKVQEIIQENVQEEAQRVPPRRPRAEERVQATAVTRRSVARPNEADFTPAKRTPRKVSSQISYTTTSGRKKSKPLDPTLVGYLVKGCWIFCAVMVLRLLFASGGVKDYYSQRSLHNERLGELDRIKKENMQLVREIERMKTDMAFQKKLVRDNLGFIASDEFLVLFPKEKSIQ